MHSAAVFVVFFFCNSNDVLRMHVHVADRPLQQDWYANSHGMCANTSRHLRSPLP